MVPRLRLERSKEMSERCEPPPEWRDVTGYEGRYQVSNTGALRRTGGGKGSVASRLLNPSLTDAGYLRVVLSSGNRQKAAKVHRLVAAAFIGPAPPGAYVLHGDGNRTNNHISNLRYGSAKDNQADAVKHGTYRDLRGSQIGTAKLNENAVRSIRSDRSKHSGQLAKIYAVDPSTIRRVRNGKDWRHV